VLAQAAEDLRILDTVDERRVITRRNTKGRRVPPLSPSVGPAFPLLAARMKSLLVFGLNSKWLKSVPGELPGVWPARYIA
jgi:hypothetical protein